MCLVFNRQQLQCSEAYGCGEYWHNTSAALDRGNVFRSKSDVLEGTEKAPAAKSPGFWRSRSSFGVGFHCGVLFSVTCHISKKTGMI